ncbi:helicase HerA domain-containing protein [Hydrogenimonas sp.]
MSELFEKMGLFYLGDKLSTENLTPTGEPMLLKSKAFATHAAIIGMTGSGKTGLGVGLLEEAAIDNIPVIIIDPKGDMGDLCLAFNELRAEQFLPWVEEEARAKGEEPLAYAQKVATMWREGIEQDGQSLERIARFKTHDATIYTPGSSAGVPVNVLGALDSPGPDILDDADAFADAVESTTASLLGLLGIDADPLASPEFILLSLILKTAWQKGESLSIESLVGRIVTPPFKRIGVLPLESFYPADRRFRLATRFNALLAGPGFAQWLEGEPLAIDRLLYDAKGRSKISIFSIAHLSERERMFFVTLLLSRLESWMRRQSGAERLRMMLYMDEIYGYFPPTKNPPSKAPMIRLLKQARAFGVSLVLSTQNPVDLDYKALGNIGIWFVGRLQTDQDIAKVAGALTSRGELDKGRLSEILRNLPKRVFFLKNAHDRGTALFRTRWVLSYLKGPLKEGDIARLMAPKKASFAGESSAKTQAPSFAAAPKTDIHPPILPSSIPQRFDTPASRGGRYTPMLAFKAAVTLQNAARGIEETRTFCTLVPPPAGDAPLPFDEAFACDDDPGLAPQKPAGGIPFAPLPPSLMGIRSLTPFKKAYADHLYRTVRLTLYRCKALKLESKPGESLEAFQSRVQQLLEEKREQEAQKIQARYQKRLETLQRRLRRAQERLAKEQEDVTATTTGSFIDVGLAVFGALFGSRRSAASKVGRAVKGGQKILKERSDVERAQARVEEVESQIEALHDELNDKLDALFTRYDAERFPITTFFIKPRRSDVKIEEALLYWGWEPV